MNSKMLGDYLAAAAACAPAESFAGPRALADAVAASAPAARWELGVRGGDAPLLRLALRATAALDAPLAASAARLLGVRAAALAGEPAASRPGLEAVWNSKTSRWVGVDVARRGRRGETLRRLSPEPGLPRTLADKRFSPAQFEEPVASLLAEFNSLSPIARVQFAAGRPGWTLRLAAPPAWPMFLRCDVAAPFAARAAQSALLLRDARVAALDFDGDALWALLGA